MSETAQNLFMMLGAGLIVIGALMLVFRPVAGENSMKLFGQEVRISAPGLVVIVLGCVMFAAPFLIPLRPGAQPAIRQADLMPKPDGGPQQDSTPKQDVAPKPDVATQDTAPKPDTAPKQDAAAAPPASSPSATPGDASPSKPDTAPTPPPQTSEAKSEPADPTPSAAPPSARPRLPISVIARNTSLLTLRAAPRCKSGYVWRVARSTDYVCVPPASRSRTAQENALAASRVDPKGAYGPATCIGGYVWREAYAGDVVCVVPAVRSLVRDENRFGPERTEQ